MDYQAPDRTGYCAIPVLEFLKGDMWDDRVLDFIHALRPSSIRVVPYRALQTDDASLWRVTVNLTDDNFVRRIEQEVEVGLRTADNGHGLINKLPRGTRPKGGMTIINTRAIKVLQRSQRRD